MQTDRYTKAVLTVIAVSLAAIAVGQFVPPARASLMGECGDAGNPCYVTAGPKTPVYVAAPPSEPVYVAIDR